MAEEKTGLGTGAKIGIAVAAFFVLGGLATAVIVSTNKKQRSADGEKAPDSSDKPPVGPTPGSGFYASTDTYNKLTLNKYATWLDNQTDSELQNYWNVERKLFGEKKYDWNGGKLDAIGAAVDGWFKGMNLRRRSDYVYMFQDDIKNYLAKGGPPHWDVTTGEYLNFR